MTNAHIHTKYDMIEYNQYWLDVCCRAAVLRILCSVCLSSVYSDYVSFEFNNITALVGRSLSAFHTATSNNMAFPKIIIVRLCKRCIQ